MNKLLVSLFARTDLAMFSPNRAKYQQHGVDLTCYIAGQVPEQHLFEAGVTAQA